MIFEGISRVFSTVNEQQYETIGAFWDELSAQYGLENLRGLGYNWTPDTIEYVIGWMLLDDGIYGEKQILSKEWIGQMTAPLLPLGEMFGYMYYGYLWYRPEKDGAVFAAIGDGGNVIYVNTEKKIAVGVTGTFKPRIFDRVEFIEKNVVPLIEE